MKKDFFCFLNGTKHKIRFGHCRCIFQQKKWGSIFFTEKRPNQGGGSEGGLAKDHTFSGFFFRLPSLTIFICIFIRKKEKNERTKESASTPSPPSRRLLHLASSGSGEWRQSQRKTQRPISNANPCHVYCSC